MIYIVIPNIQPELEKISPNKLLFSLRCCGIIVLVKVDTVIVLFHSSTPV